MSNDTHKECPFVDCASSDAFSLLEYDKGTGQIYRKDLKRFVGSLLKTGYLMFDLKGTRLYSHRVAFYLTTGRWPIQVDHMNGVRHDNRWENLREANTLQQATNKVGWGLTGCKGISWHKYKQKYHARVAFKGKTHHVGYFDNLEEAKYSRDIKAKQLHGEFFNDKHRTPSLSL